MTDSGWLDMTLYPALDPDTALSPAHLQALHDALAVDEDALPTALWDDMLTTAVTAPPDTTTDDTDDTDDHHEHLAPLEDTDSNPDTAHPDDGHQDDGHQDDGHQDDGVLDPGHAHGDHADSSVDAGDSDITIVEPGYTDDSGHLGFGGDW